MNIHFTDKVLFKKLKEATLAKVIVGSRMYGTENINSDIDYLYIYATSDNELNSFIQSHHQLQYKENNIDYNFVSLHTFMKNIINGDSTINFEVIQSESLINTDLEWLHDFNDTFITYTLIRSYLGFARRDLKHYHKAKTEYEKKKKLGHIIRGWIYARVMLYHQWDFKLANIELKSIIKDLDVSNNFTLREYEKNISNLRNELNEKFNNHTLNYAQHIDVEKGKILLDKFLLFCDSDIFIKKQSVLVDFDLSEFINSFENWVTY